MIVLFCHRCRSESGWDDAAFPRRDLLVPTRDERGRITRFPTQNFRCSCTDQWGMTIVIQDR